MQVRNNEIYIQRGESWTMSKKVKNKDDSPYIVSSRLNNPHWLITVSSSRYMQANRYVFNKWLSLKNLPRFEITRPVNIKNINPEYTFENMNVPSGYEGDETSGYANIALFYEKDLNGVISYRYWEYNNNEEDDFDGKWSKYDCNIITTFGSDITSKWIEQNYFYSILLVDGVENFDYDKPLSHVTERFKILEPTKLYVRSDLKGGLV